MSKENIGRVVPNLNDFITIVSKSGVSVGTTSTSISIGVSLKKTPVSIIPVAHGGSPFMISVNSWSENQINISVKATESLTNRTIQLICFFN